MNQSTDNQISRLKDQLIMEIRASDSLDKVVNQKIDRDFNFDMTRISDTELDSELHKKMSEVNDNLFYVKHKFNAKFNNSRFFSSVIFNNKLVKLVLFPFFLLFYIPRKIGRVFENLLLINQLLPYRFHRFNQKIHDLEEKIKTLEFNNSEDEK